MTDPMSDRPTHVIIVDDEASTREMVGEYLGLQGFHVTLCDGGASLRRVLAVETADLVLLDLNMPVEDGLSIVRFIKQTTVLPVILLTATASAIDRVVGLEMGADDYIAKPCELRELLARMRAVLRRARRPASALGERRLSAIASFDQVGFSRAVQNDETATLAGIERVFGEIIGPTVAQRRGLMFKKLGDGALVEFASVVDAVEWAVAFQAAVHATPAAAWRGDPIRFRVGIAIGDIVVAGQDRLGEAIALAVRVQEHAQPGAVALSDYTWTLSGSRVGHRFVDLGLCRLKNIAEPMRLWQWHPEDGPAQLPSTST